MCYVCLKDDLFERADVFGQRFGKSMSGPKPHVKAKLIYIKQAIRVIEDEESENESRCDDGEKSLQQLKDEQYRLSREL